LSVAISLLFHLLLLWVFWARERELLPANEILETNLREFDKFDKLMIYNTSRLMILFMLDLMMGNAYGCGTFPNKARGLG
jgi:hypothetical protein